MLGCSINNKSVFNITINIFKKHLNLFLQMFLFFFFLPLE